MKTIITILLLMFGAGLYGQIQISTETAQRLAKKDKALKEQLIQSSPDLFPIVIGRDKLKIKKDVVAIGDSDTWIMRISSIDSSYFELNSSLFKFRIENLSQDTITQEVLVIEPK